MRRPAALAIAALLLAAPPAGAQSQRTLDSLAARVAADSNDPATHYELARALISKKRWDAAEVELLQVTTLDPQHGGAWMALGLLPARRGDGYWRKVRKERGPLGADTVLAELRRAQRRGFLLDPAADLESFGMVEDELLGPSFKMFMPWWYPPFAKAVKATAKEKPGDAYAELGKLLADPRTRGGRTAPAWLLHFHGVLALELGKYDSATADFMLLTGRAFYAETLGVLPVLAANDARYALATSRLLAGELHEAAATYRRVLELDASVWQAHGQLARIHEALGLYEEAVSERQRAIDVNPDDWSLQFELGITLTRAGRLDEAQEVLERVVAAAPRSARAWATLGMVAQDLGNLPRARDAYTRCVAVAPRRLAHLVSEVNTRLASLP